MLYRKAQIHPTVVYSAVQNALACTAAGLGPAECFVQVGGGTPDGIVAAAMLGFGRVIYVGHTPQEVNGMRLPTPHEEQVHNIDYHEYTSPDADDPERGTIVAHAIQLLTPYVRNFVMETPGSIVVPTTHHVEVPPIQVFTFVPVTGKVIARTIGGSTPSSGAPGGQQSSSSNSKSAEASSVPAVTAVPKKTGPGSASGDVPPKTPKKKITIEQDEGAGDDDEDDDSDDNDANDEGGEGLDAELAAIDEMAGSAKKKPKRKAGSEAGSTKKKKKKSGAAA